MISDIKDIISQFKNGEMIILIDDEDRENEGDLVISSKNLTPEHINFMITHAKGLVCAQISSEIASNLKLSLMEGVNNEMETQFTASVDLKGEGVTTGISAEDRYKTIIGLTNKDATRENFSIPGHIFPLQSMDGGVLRRAGHTEAAIDLSRLAGFEPAGCIVEIMNEDGSMARLPDLMKVAKKHDMKIVSIADLIEYRLKHESLIERQIDVQMPTNDGSFDLVAYKQTSNGMDHLALVKGKWEDDEPILVRVHSSCLTGDIFGSCRCDCGEQLKKAMQTIEEEGKGVIVYMNQEGRGIGLINKLKAYKLQENGMDTVEANLELGFQMDERDYGVGAQILRDLGVRKIKLMSNNPKKRKGLIGYGLEIVENVALQVEPNPHNKSYLTTKKEKMGHDL